MRAKLLPALLLPLLAVPLAAQSKDSFRLDNGIRVVMAEDHSAPICSAVLVCPLTGGAVANDYTGVALLNRLIWGGGRGFGVAVREHEYRMIALRFGGSIGSQLAADALLIHYTLPPELLPNIFAYMALQMSTLEFEPERLEAARQAAAGEENAARASSVLAQLLREIEPRIWSDLPYRFRSLGSGEALLDADAESVRAAFRHLRDPYSWTLVVAGDVNRVAVEMALAETLATLQPDDHLDDQSPVAEADPGREPEFGLLLQLPAQLSRRHALVAFRLPPASVTDEAGLLLLGEYLRRCSALRELRRELGGDEPAEVSVVLDNRRMGGMLYLYAAWRSDFAAELAAARLGALAAVIATDGPEPAAMEAARSSLLISYWNRRLAVQPYALWRGLRAAIGTGGDILTRLEGLGSEDLQRLAGELLGPGNRLSLITVER